MKLINMGLDNVPEIFLRGILDEYNCGNAADYILTTNSKLVRFRINSVGGYINKAFTLLTAMQDFKNAGGEIETINEGLAASAASWIFAAGTKGKRRIMQYATTFVHAPTTEDGRKINEVDGELREAMEANFNSLIDIVSPLTGLSTDKCREYMENESEFDAKESVRLGFADIIGKVSEPPKIEKTTNLNKRVLLLNAYLERKETSHKPIKDEAMKKVAELLNLRPEASEDSIMNAVKDALNLTVKLKAENESLINKVEEANTAKSELNAKNESLTKEIDELKNVKVVDFINKKVADGVILEADKERFLNLAKTDFELVEKMFVQKNQVIDHDIDPQGGDKNAETLKLGREFMNMSNEEQKELQRLNPEKYNELVEAYEKM